ncbi:uncharacterized protein LOC142761673 isoform X4 [Rhipicephalus microplus]|uniref:uncharacterized protein LOC142761673 isoform X4 n=1 Tax=Rhipicephalus microplus TaxID=6941 RepID=UPI003F6AA492
MAGRSFHSQFRPVLGQGSGQRWPPPLEQFQSSTEIRLWLPQIQKEIEVCLQRSQDAWEFASSPILSLQRKSKKPNVDSLWHHQCVEDSAQPTDKVADFQLRASQLQDYYQACEGRLRELEGEETSSMSDSVLVTVTHHVSVTAANDRPAAGGFRR